MENKKLIRRLNWDYYGMFALACLSATAMYLGITHEVFAPISPKSTVGSFIQYFVIMDALITIPFGLFWHKRACKRIMTIEDEHERTVAYCRSARWRIYLVSNALVLGIIAYYLLADLTPKDPEQKQQIANNSMIWIAGISAIGWYFTKPSEYKMMMELQPESY